MVGIEERARASCVEPALGEMPSRMLRVQGGRDEGHQEDGLGSPRRV